MVAVVKKKSEIEQEIGSALIKADILTQKAPDMHLLNFHAFTIKPACFDFW